MRVRIFSEASLNVTLTSSDHYNTTRFPASNIQTPFLNRPWRAAAGGSAQITVLGIDGTNNLSGILLYGLELNGQTLTIKDATTATTVAATTGAADPAGVTRIFIQPGLSEPGNAAEPSYNLTVSGSAEWSIGAVYSLNDPTSAALNAVGRVVEGSLDSFKVDTTLNSQTIRDKTGAIHRLYAGTLSVFDASIGITPLGANFFHKYLTGLTGLRNRSNVRDGVTVNNQNISLLEVYENVLLGNTNQDRESSVDNDRVWPVALAVGSSIQSTPTGIVDAESVASYKLKFRELA